MILYNYKRKGETKNDYETLSPQPHKTIYGYSFSGYSFDDNLDNWKHRHN